MASAFVVGKCFLVCGIIIIVNAEGGGADDIRFSLYI